MLQELLVTCWYLNRFVHLVYFSLFFFIIYFCRKCLFLVIFVVRCNRIIIADMFCLTMWCINVLVAWWCELVWCKLLCKIVCLARLLGLCNVTCFSLHCHVVCVLSKCLVTWLARKMFASFISMLNLGSEQVLVESSLLLL